MGRWCLALWCDAGADRSCACRVQAVQRGLLGVLMLCRAVLRAVCRHHGQAWQVSSRGGQACLHRLRATICSPAFLEFQRTCQPFIHRRQGSIMCARSQQQLLCSLHGYHCEQGMQAAPWPTPTHLSTIARVPCGKALFFSARVSNPAVCCACMCSARCAVRRCWRRLAMDCSPTSCCRSAAWCHQQASQAHTKPCSLHRWGRDTLPCSVVV